MSDPRLQSTEYLRVLREHCAAGKGVTPACVLAVLDHCDALEEQLAEARKETQ